MLIDLQDELKLWEKPRDIIQTLEHLQSQRERFVKVLTQLSIPLEESKAFYKKEDHRMLVNSSSSSIESLKDSIKQRDEKIKCLIASDEKLKVLHNQVSSVIGVGVQTANELIIASNEFRKITDSSKMACYAGVAPFEHTSGTSLKGKSRVSHLANKPLKRLLHLAALSTIRGNNELASYYKNQLSKGKNKMSVINAIRNKLLHRVYACVREQRLYQPFTVC